MSGNCSAEDRRVQTRSDQIWWAAWGAYLYLDTPSHRGRTLTVVSFPPTTSAVLRKVGSLQVWGSAGGKAEGNEIKK